MSFTPTNSILNRDEVDTARMSQVVYENESLKIQVETLQEKLQSTGLLKLDTLRQENDSLRSELATLRVQLEEKTAQLEHNKTSDDRFSNIDQSLQELLTQIHTQRTEMAGMRDSTREKDARIAELTAQLKDVEAALGDAQAQLTSVTAAATQNGAQSMECSALREQVAQLNAEMDTLRRASEEEVTGLQRSVEAAQAELLALKDDAAAKSAMKGDRMTSQEKEMADCREREASSQRQVVELQARLELLRTECSQLKGAQAELLRKQQEQQYQHQQQLASAAVVAASSRVDLYCPEVKAYVERAVQNATDGVQRRLKEQVEQNASLLSRMALIQQESEAMLKSKGMSNHEVTVMKERVDMRSRRNDARHSMQRRVAELLSSEELSKEDIELLLQEMLDYQEDQDQENRTLLLVKDMEAEERERALRRELKRVKDENASLMKQLQQLAMEGFHRDRSSSLPGTSGGAAAGATPTGSGGAPHAAAAREFEPSPAVAHGADAAMPPATAVPRRPSFEPAVAMPEPAYHLPSDRMEGGGGLTPQRPTAGVAGPSSASSGPPQLRQTAPQPSRGPNQFGGDLWSNPPSRAAAGHHAQPQYTQPQTGHADPQAPYYYGGPDGGFSSGDGNRAAAEGNRAVMVHCPACTYKQRYGNQKCEICDAVLQLP